MSSIRFYSNETNILKVNKISYFKRTGIEKVLPSIQVRMKRHVHLHTQLHYRHSFYGANYENKLCGTHIANY